MKELRTGDVEAFIARFRTFFADFNVEVKSVTGCADAMVKTTNAVYDFKF